MVSVIVQTDETFDPGQRKFLQFLKKSDISPTRQLDLVDGVAMTMPAKWLKKLDDLKGLTITPDAPVHVSGYSSKQLWPYEVGLANTWSGWNALAPALGPDDRRRGLGHPGGSGRLRQPRARAGQLQHAAGQFGR